MSFVKILIVALLTFYSFLLFLYHLILLMGVKKRDKTWLYVSDYSRYAKCQRRSPPPSNTASSHLFTNTAIPSQITTNCTRLDSIYWPELLNVSHASLNLSSTGLRWDHTCGRAFQHHFWLQLWCKTIFFPDHFLNGLRWHCKYKTL